MKGVILLIATALPLQMMAQVFKTSNQNIVEEAVESGLVIFSQGYQLQDISSNQIYGRNGLDEFGRSYSIGIKVEDHLIVPKSVLSPWETDPAYQRYSSTHRPLLYKSKVRIVCDTLEYGCNPFIDSTSLRMDNRFIQLEDTSCLNYPGFDKDTLPGKKEGWLVWITSDNPIEMSETTGKENLMIYKKDLILSADSLQVKIDNPQTEKKILGGIYITPVQTKVGTIQFYISGIMCCIDEQWYVYTPFLNIQATTDEEENELTLITGDQNEWNDTSNVSSKIIRKKKRSKNN